MNMKSFFDWLETHKTARTALSFLIFFGPLLIYLVVAKIMDSD